MIHIMVVIRAMPIEYIKVLAASGWLINLWKFSNEKPPSFDWKAYTMIRMSGTTTKIVRKIT